MRVIYKGKPRTWRVNGNYVEPGQVIDTKTEKPELLRNKFFEPEKPKTEKQDTKTKKPKAEEIDQ